MPVGYINWSGEKGNTEDDAAEGKGRGGSGINPAPAKGKPVNG